jgi:hypothetical protein
MVDSFLDREESAPGKREEASTYSYFTSQDGISVSSLRVPASAVRPKTARYRAATATPGKST